MKSFPAVVLSFLFIVSASSQNTLAAEGMEPLAPHRLLKIMPVAPDGWTLAHSTAEKRLGDWIETYAERVFRKIPSTPGALPPPVTTVSVTDTASFPGTTAMFDDFRPGEEEKYEKRIVDGNPAFLFPLGEDEHETILLVAGRFLISILTEQQGAEERDDWLSRIDFDTFEAVPDSKKIILPEVIQIVVIDELNPKRSRTYPLATPPDPEKGEEE